MKLIFINSSKIKKIIFILSILIIGILMVLPVLAYDYENPLGETNDISMLVSNIINFLIILAIPVTAILIVYAGFLYIASAGNNEKVKTAQKTLIWAIVGFAIVLVASSIPVIIEEFLSGESTTTDTPSTNSLPESVQI